MKLFTVLLISLITCPIFGQVELNFIQKKSGSDLTYYCVVERFDEMMGFQSTLTWNPDTMAYTRIDFIDKFSSAMVNPKMVDKGQLPLIWLTTDGPLTLQPCDTVFVVEFRDKLGLSPLKFGNVPVKTEFVDMDGIVNVSSRLVATCGLTNTRNQTLDAGFRILPNVMEHGEFFKVWSEKSVDVDIEVYDAQGVLVLTQKNVTGKEVQAPGAAGVYFYTLKAAGRDIQSGKIVVF